MATSISDRAAREDATVVYRAPRRVAVDVALAFVWVPFALVAHRIETDQVAITAFASAVLLLSFAHQPLTLALVYGDAAQFRLRPALFTWSPVVFAVAVAAGILVSPALLAIIGGLWNAEHTLMQRYGVTRVYGRLVGQDDGRLERTMLLSWLLLALVWNAADTRLGERIAFVDLGASNRDALQMLADVQAVAIWLVPFAVGAALATAVLWIRAERRRQVRNSAKWVYVGSTALLFALMLVDPIAGLLGYVGAHAVEYFVVVYGSLGRRYVANPADRAPLGRAVRAPTGRLGFLAVYVGLVTLVVTVLGRVGSPVLYLVVFFTLGGLHVFYDGFIWKLRRPEVAASVVVARSAAGR